MNAWMNNRDKTTTREMTIETKKRKRKSHIIFMIQEYDYENEEKLC